MSTHDGRSKGAEIATGPLSKLAVTENRYIFCLEGVSKRWAGDHGFILTVPTLRIGKGGKLALVEFSGCGKSTLLDLLAMVLRPDNADEFSFFAGRDDRLDVIDAWRRKDLDTLANARMRHMGYVLQTGGLFPFLSVRDNIGLISGRNF